MKWVGGILGIIALYVFFLWASYLDVTVTSGEAYGFRIGDTKTEAYNTAREIFQGKRVYIPYPVRRGHTVGPLYEFSFSEDEYPIISNRDVWKIYLSGGAYSSIQLTFSDDMLIEIYRHRKYFEPP